MECITRMVEDEDEQTLIDVQIDDFRKRAKCFGCPFATRSTNLKTSVDWWESLHLFRSIQREEIG